ncbi:MAG: AtpZ/AtpI family protein [Alphaproteobacteria bacterium]|nr:AtpZ/AtpI family protein [Alphaproteobacteria bacterium]
MSELPQDIKDIDRRIRNLKETKEEKKVKSSVNTLLQQAFRFAAEFISPVTIALVLGYWADDIFKTKPIIMLVSTVFGCAAGVLNVYKAALETDKDIR